MIFVIPGTHPTLAMAEFHALDPNGKWRLYKDVIVGNPSDGLAKIVTRSAGAVKAGKILLTVPMYKKEEMAALLASMIEQGGRQTPFGISVYDGENTARAHAMRKDTRALGMEIKHAVKERGGHSRFVTSTEPTLSSVVVATNHLLDQGAEFVLFPTADEIAIGETEWVQDFEAWGRRDFGRPARDAKAGMLPPKIARLIINLARAEEQTSSLWDPFCGSGTVLMEATLLGFKRIVGSDIETKAIKRTTTNIEWLERTEKIRANVEVLVHDATQPLPKEFEGTFDAIVAEGDLGPPQKGRERESDLTQTQKKLEKLYTQSLPRLAERLKQNGRLVLALPVFRRATNTQLLHFDIPSSLSLETPRGSLLYARPNQKVGREIIVCKKK